MLKLQIISDAHLEFRRNPAFFKPSAPILCLLGDICACGTLSGFRTFVNFLKFASPQFEKIIHVAGNHEYYATTKNNKKIEQTYEGINVRLANLKKMFPNYIFMNNNVFKLRVGTELVYVIGTTLWSHIPVDKRPTVKNIMNDYNMLYKIDAKTHKIRRWSVNDVVKLHANSVKLIKRTTSIAKKQGIKCILLTHHKPIMDGPETYSQYCYESDLEHLIKDPIIFAAHGHTHVKYMKRINDVPVVSNPRGYPGEKTYFDPELFVAISL